MPHIPDVGILHCGELPHHKMGIKVQMSLFLTQFVSLILCSSTHTKMLKGDQLEEFCHIMICVMLDIQQMLTKI